MKETQIHKLKMYHRIILFVVALCCTLSSHAVTYPSSPYISTNSGHSGGAPRVTAYSGYQANYTPQSPLSSPIMLLSDDDETEDDEGEDVPGGGTNMDNPGEVVQDRIPVGDGIPLMLLLLAAYMLYLKRIRQCTDKIKTLG